MPPIQAKICGLTTPETVIAAVDADAAFIGFMNFARSPRHIEPKNARRLADVASDRARVLERNRPRTVSIMVSPSLEMVEGVIKDLNPDYIQLHGNESVEFCESVGTLGVKVIKALGVSQKSDLEQAVYYMDWVDIILFDAKPPTSSEITGGWGHTFDWSILHKYHLPIPWMLSGGLNASNVREAVTVTGAKMVDVSSGVERARGLKDKALIAGFMAALNLDT
jgi:phosphoribosylanthranilate isomerase